mgnify:CR=1 FL=1
MSRHSSRVSAAELRVSRRQQDDRSRTAADNHSGRLATCTARPAIFGCTNRHSCVMLSCDEGWGLLAPSSTREWHAHAAALGRVTGWYAHAAALGCVTGWYAHAAALGCITEWYAHAAALGCITGWSAHAAALGCITGWYAHAAALGCITRWYAHAAALGCAGVPLLHPGRKLSTLHSLESRVRLFIYNENHICCNAPWPLVSCNSTATGGGSRANRQTLLTACTCLPCLLSVATPPAMCAACPGDLCTLLQMGRQYDINNSASRCSNSGRSHAPPPLRSLATCRTSSPCLQRN